MGFGRAEEDRPTPKEVYNLRIYILALCATMGVFLVLFCFTRRFNSYYQKHPYNDILGETFLYLSQGINTQDMD